MNSLYRNLVANIIYTCLSLISITLAPLSPFLLAQTTGIDPDRSGADVRTRLKDGYQPTTHRVGPREALLAESGGQEGLDVYSAQESWAGSHKAASSDTKTVTADRTTVVHSTADSGPGSLRQALADASSGDTINIVANGTITLSSGELLVDKSLTIRGPGKTHGSISGNGQSRVFHITPGVTVSIESLNIINGRAENPSGGYLANAGGGIYTDHATLTLRDCIIMGNFARRLGGGIFSNSLGGGSASVALIDTSVADNSAGYAFPVVTGYGGGIFSGGGFLGESASGGTELTLKNSSLTGNSARFGGAIFNDGFLGTATLTLNNSTISTFPNNQGSSTGLAIFNNGDSGVAKATLTSSSVIGIPPEYPHPDSSNGAIFNDGTASISPGSATLEMTDSSITDNSAFRAGVVNDGWDGSAVATLNHDVFTGTGFGIQNVGEAIVNNSTFRGAGIFNGFGTLTVNQSTVTESVDQSYGAINNIGFTIVNNSTVSGNALGIRNACGGVLTVNGSSVSRNGGDSGNGGILNYCDLGPNVIGDTTVTLIDSLVDHNQNYGVLNYASNGSVAKLNLINSTVSTNSGVGIYTSGVDPGGTGSMILQNSTISDNSASGIQNISLFGGSALAEITNTIINAGASGSIGSLDGTVISHGYNLTSDNAGGLLNGPGDILNANPMLGPLRNNGGPTLTHALQRGSPAINAGDPAFNPYLFIPPLLFDQRGTGFARVINGRIDIGAFESRN